MPNGRLREERELHSWTHKDIAERIDLPDPRTVGRWERGISFPSAHYRQALCRIFEKQPEELGLLKRSEDEEKTVTGGEQDGTIYRLPTPFLSFVGRKPDIDVVVSLLLRADIRMVSLLGTGGIGKTRLALEIAARTREHFRGGVCFVALDTLRDSSLVPALIVEALGLQVNARPPLVQQLKSFLKKKHLLLLIDNFEYVVQASPFIEELLQDCPHIKVLVTSRQRLAIGAEQPFELQPLTLPNLAQLPEVDALTRYSAIDLFVRRAQTALPDFKLTLANAQIIAELCVRLDGLPLAIELAAAHIKVLTPQSLLTRLIQDTRILRSRLRNVPDRHRTLEYTIDWSYELLDAREKWLFRHLAVFAGGATFETIEEFFQSAEQRPVDLLETVDSLLTKCLLYNVKQESEERRFGMLETIRTYGLNSLQTEGELATSQRAYALYYLTVVERAASELKGPQQALWLAQLDREQKNLRAALGWLVEQGETGLALRFCESFGKYCGLCGYWMEERHWLDVVLALPGAEQHAAIRARVLRRAGHLAYRLRELAAARELFEQSITYAREANDKSTLAGALSGLSRVVYRQKEIARADSLLKESIEAAKQAHDDWSLANVLESRGRFLHYQGYQDEARNLLEQSVAMARKLSDKENLARTLTTLVDLEIAQANIGQARKLANESFNLAIALKTRPLIALTLDRLGDVALFEGAYDQARQYIEERIIRARELGDMATVAHRQLKLADIALAQGVLEEATKSIRAVEDSLATLREQEDIPGIIDALSVLADLHRSAGNLLQARSLYLEALQLYREFEEERKIGRCLIGLAQTFLDQEQADHATYLYGAIEARWRATTTMHPAQRTSYEGAMSQARTMLSKEDFDQAWSAGGAATLDMLIATIMERGEAK
ncbi:MAG: hypothetical protein NVS4B9_30740 [Ktedonobacteraceae bacterium]